MATGVQCKGKYSSRKSLEITLSYDCKKDESDIISYRGDTFEKVASLNGDSRNIFFYGDNKDALSHLLHSGYSGTVSLIYIDPPFSTSSEFTSKNMSHAYSDSLRGGQYIEFLRERLILLRELLSNRGSIYLHLDGNMAFSMKQIMDEVFGLNNFRAFITRQKCSVKNYTRKTYGNISDYILFYTKSSNYIWNRPYEPWDENRLSKEYPNVDEKTGKRYKKVPLHAPGIRKGETGKEWRGMVPPRGKHWQYTPEKLDALDAAGEIYWSPTGNPRRKVFHDPDKGIPVQDIWLKYRDSINQAQKTTGYPTEKNYDMLKMIVMASSNPNDIVLDCFSGSGTTLDAAYRCGRKWIGADNSVESLKSVLKRFNEGLDTYGDYVNDKQRYKQSYPAEENKCAFSIYSTVSMRKDVIAILNSKEHRTPEHRTQ